DTPLSRLGSPAQILQEAAAVPVAGKAPVAGKPSAAAVQTVGTQAPAASPAPGATRGAGVRQAAGSGTVGSGVLSAPAVVHTSDGYAPAPIRKKPAWVPQD